MLRRWPAFLAALVLTGSLLGAASARDERYGGVLTVGLSGGDPSSLDPTVSVGGFGIAEVFQTMCQRLYETNGKLQPVPVLAAALPVLSKDKLSYTVQLRQGVRFNDGTPFNAQAVVTSVQRLMTYPGSTQAGFFASVDSVSTPGPYTVVYHLKARDSTFTGNAYVLSPAALASGGDFAAHPVCVGPFMFVHRVPGDNITVIKSPYYWDTKDVFLDKIVFKPAPDPAAAATALRAGDIQVLDNLSTSQLPFVEQDSSIDVVKAFQLGWQGILINMGNRGGVGSFPYQNVGTPLASSAKLRHAFEEAIDRAALNRVVYGGLQQVTCTMIPPADLPWFQATKVPCTAYDPKDAKRLVAQSGFTSPTVHLLVPNSADKPRWAQFLQAQEAAVGINVVIDLFDTPTTQARRTVGNFDAYLGGFAPGGVDPTSTIQLATSNPRNYGGYSNGRLNYVLANGLKASDPKARAVNYRVAQQIILTERPYIAFFNPATFAAHESGVAGVALTANGIVTVAGAWYR